MANNYRIIFSDTVIRELEKISIYITENLSNRKAFVDLRKEIVNQLENIMLYPYMGKTVREFKNIEIRKLFVKNYVLLYTVFEDKSEILFLHIFYASSEWMKKI